MAAAPREDVPAATCPFLWCPRLDSNQHVLPDTGPQPAAYTIPPRGQTRTPSIRRPFLRRQAVCNVCKPPPAGLLGRAHRSSGAAQAAGDGVGSVGSGQASRPVRRVLATPAPSTTSPTSS